MVGHGVVDAVTEVVLRSRRDHSLTEMWLTLDFTSMLSPFRYCQCEFVIPLLRYQRMDHDRSLIYVHFRNHASAHLKFTHGNSGKLLGHDHRNQAVWFRIIGWIAVIRTAQDRAHDLGLSRKKVVNTAIALIDARGLLSLNICSRQSVWRTCHSFRRRLRRKIPS
jgi:hypothetical protein